MARSYVCDDCGTPGTQVGGGKLQRRCDRCRAGTGGNTPRKRDLPTPGLVDRTAAAMAAPTAASSVLEAVRADLDALMTPHPMADGLRALALELAARIADCEEKTLPSLARELRATLDSLASYSGGGDDEADGDIDLSAEVLDPPQS